MSKIYHTINSPSVLDIYYLLNSKIEKKKPDMICPNCGASMVSGRHCEYCGLKSKKQIGGK